MSKWDGTIGSFWAAAKDLGDGDNRQVVNDALLIAVYKVNAVEDLQATKHELADERTASRALAADVGLLQAKLFGVCEMVAQARHLLTDPSAPVDASHVVELLRQAMETCR